MLKQYTRVKNHTNDVDLAFGNGSVVEGNILYRLKNCISFDGLILLGVKNTFSGLFRSKEIPILYHNFASKIGSFSSQVTRKRSGI